MNKVLVTGSSGFMGKNLIACLRRRGDLGVLEYDVDNSMEELNTFLKEADIIYHLAGVNRPDYEAEFETGNAGLTETIIALLHRHKRNPPIVISSSTQAVLENPYGRSKKKAEDALFAYSDAAAAPVYVYRLTNVFGKWSRPNYNSVVSTFCYNISHDLPIQISNPQNEVELVYVDDVVSTFLRILESEGLSKTGRQYLAVSPTYKVTLGDLAERVYQLRDMHKTLVVPDLSDGFMRCLYATYLSYLDLDAFSYDLDTKADERGCLAELIKSNHFGQIFVSRTHPGVTRGNHYHDSKVEKFCVVQGEGVIRFRHILASEIFSYHVSGGVLQVVDIPPGYTHSIENTGDNEMIVLFWADQVFDPGKPDTHFCPVIGDA